ncbi:hypothetical protein DUI70_2185 [Streptomyces albus]|nr:hypothetical protein DUI70_2185 [Streptomyces albus]
MTADRSGSDRRMARLSEGLGSLSGMDDSPALAPDPGSQVTPESALTYTELVGRRFAEALDAGLRRSVLTGFRPAARPADPAAGPRLPAAAPQQTGPGPARTAAEPAYEQIVASSRLLETAVATLPPGHPAGAEALRALTEATRALRAHLLVQQGG